MLAISACQHSRLAWEDCLFKASTLLSRQTFCTLLCSIAVTYAGNISPQGCLLLVEQCG